VSPRRRSVRLFALAEQDIVDICEYIAVENPSAAERVLSRIERDLSAIGTQPFVGRIPRDPDIARLGYRYFIIADYLAFYRLEPSLIVVYRIFHVARDYSEIL
jgi:toxin ParE1/3/4